MKRIIYIILLLGLVNSIQSQIADIIDSLKNVQDRTHLIDEKIANYFQLAELYRTEDLETSRLMLEHALKMAISINSEEDIARAYLAMGNRDVMFDSLDRAVNEYDNSLVYFQKLNDLRSISDVYLILGNIHFVKGNLPEAMKMYNESLIYSKQSNYSEKLPHCYNNLGVIYQSQKDYLQALEYSNIALSLFEELNDSVHIALVTGNIGSSYMMLNNLDIAKKYYEDELNLYERLGDTDGKVLAMLRLADLYIIQNQPDSALMLNNMSYSLYENIDLNYRGPKSTRYCDIYLNSGMAYKLKKEWKRAVEVFNKCYLLARRTNLNWHVMESAKLLSEVYDSLNIMDSSYKYFKVYKFYFDSLLSEDNIRNMAQMEFKYKYDQQLIKAELREKENQVIENRRTLILFIIVGCLVFILIIFVLLFKLEKSKKTKVNIERLQLKSELEFKNKELTTHMLYLLKKNEFILNISEKLKQIIPSIKVQNKKSIAEIINELNRGTSNDTWKEFEIRFQEVHTSFFDKLNKSYPDLSPNELRLCAFLRLNMSTKDISSVTYQSINSIEMARFRLRKKLGIDSIEHLVSFLSRI